MEIAFPDLFEPSAYYPPTFSSNALATAGATNDGRTQTFSPVARFEVAGKEDH